MTAMTERPEPTPTYRPEQLAAAFDRVMNSRDWKAPILAMIPTGERPLVERAVIWFTDTAPVFSPIPGDAHRLLVSAPGYRIGSGGTAG